MTSHPSASRALPLAVAIATLLFLLLGIGALGIIAEGDSDRIYLAVVAVFIVGAFAMGEHQSPGASASDMVMLTTMYASLFAFAAWLFARVAGVPPR